MAAHDSSVFAQTIRTASAFEVAAMTSTLGSVPRRNWLHWAGTMGWVTIRSISEMLTPCRAIRCCRIG